MPIDIMREYWIELADGARNGNVEAAQHLLTDFADTVGNIEAFKDPERAWSGPIPWQIAEFLAGAFRKMLCGTDANKALGLVGKTRGRRKGKSKTHDLDAIAAAFYLLRRKGWKAEQANEALFNTLGVNRVTVHRARKKKEAFQYPKLISDEMLKVKMRPYVSKIAPLLKSGNKKTEKSSNRK
jgi:hypothetical protein